MEGVAGSLVEVEGCVWGLFMDWRMRGHHQTLRPSSVLTMLLLRHCSKQHRYLPLYKH